MPANPGSCSNSETLPEWITGFHETPAGQVPQIAARWGKKEKRGRLLCRFSNAFRMSYIADPGLYAVGCPAPESPVLVTANFKLSLDMLRRELAGIDAWILVLDTKGINVWCAAGKGTFGTLELIRRLREVNLSAVVRHRSLILPQLGAPGIQAHAVKEQTGFVVHYGPIRARDVPAYLQAGRKATAAMRTVRFGFLDRLELTPMEVVPALKRYPWMLLGLFVLFGLQPQGILFREALFDGWPFAVLAAIMIFTGSFLTPLFLPAIPFRSFAVKGWLTGAVFTAGFLVLRLNALRTNVFLLVLTAILFPTASSFLALLFTGSTTFTGISGVRKEMRFAIPLYIAALALSGALAILYLLQKWGIL